MIGESQIRKYIKKSMPMFIDMMANDPDIMEEMTTHIVGMMQDNPDMLKAYAKSFMSSFEIDVATTKQNNTLTFVLAGEEIGQVEIPR